MAFTYMWPNPYYQEPEQECFHASSRITLGSENNSRFELVIGEIPPTYTTVSPSPPSPPPPEPASASEEVNRILCQV